MIITTEMLASYLGKHASKLLADPPFQNWKFERTYETDLEEPLIDYVFAQHGIDIVCDREDRVNSLFLYFDERRFFRETIKDIPFTLNRQEVFARLGAPCKSGSRLSDPVLGDYGAWDRFAHGGYFTHVEYQLDGDRIRKITLMRSDVVP